MIIHHIINLKILDNYELLATFENGKRKKYDMKPLMEKMNPFKPLYMVKLFKKAKVDNGGYGVVWNDQIDIAAEEIYYNGIDV